HGRLTDRIPRSVDSHPSNEGRRKDREPSQRRPAAPARAFRRGPVGRCLARGRYLRKSCGADAVARGGGPRRSQRVPKGERPPRPPPLPPPLPRRPPPLAGARHPAPHLPPTP